MRVSLVVAILAMFPLVFPLAQDVVMPNDAVALALENGYDIRVAKNTENAALIDNNYVIGAFLPQINALGATVWSRNNQKLEFQEQSRNNEGIAKSNNTSGSVQLVWTLFDGTRMFATKERVETLTAQGNLLVKDQIVNTIAATLSAYYDIVRQEQQLIAIREQMAVDEERVKLAELRVQVGTAAKPELLQARVDYNARRTSVIQQEALIAQVKEQLNVLVGKRLPQRFEVTDTIIVDPNLDYLNLSNDLQNSNYTLLWQFQNIEVASLLLKERRAELYPFLNFNAAYNFSRLDNTQLINPFGAVFSQSQGLNFGFSVDLPILNGFNRRRLVQQARLNVDREKILYDQQVANVDADLNTAIVAYTNAKRVLVIEEENISLAKENVYIALETFKRGATTFIELRTAQQSLAEAYTRLINARYLAKIAEIELLRLTGRLIN